jgi:putative hemolysin
LDSNAFSYADPSDPLWKRAAIGAVEVATGREKLKKLYFKKQSEGWNGAGFFETAIRALSLDLRYDPQRLAAMPPTGPLVVVANHPFGVLDGIVMCALMERVRPDFRVLTNAVLLRAPEMREKMLPIDFSETLAARRLSASSRGQAIEFIRAGGCVVIFPAGAVSTSPDALGRRPAVDGPWTPYLARLVAAGKGPVVPVYFPGQNSRLFQMVSHVSMTLRLSLFFHEVRRRIGTPLPVEIGYEIPYAELAGLTDRSDLVAAIRARVTALAQHRALSSPSS